MRGCSDTGWLTLRYGYLDESGDVAPFAGSRYLIVAILITSDPRPIELHIKRARRALGRKAKSDELKAADLERVVTEGLLKSLVEEDIEIVASVVDKRAILRPLSDSEDIYRAVVTQAVKLSVERHPRLELWLDKRYTKPALRDRLERTIREGITDLAHQVVLVHQEDSHKQKGLQAVDHVAWAFFQKYERKNDSLWRILASQVSGEEILDRALW
jgi:hypothetical protein